jgi:uncharacterized LabA/DUF88 family protein
VGKNVAVFVDVANIFYAAKAAGTDIDYVTLLKAATAGRDFVRAYAYTGLDPDNENQRNFHAFLARNHYKVVSKDIRKYGDGKVKANLDIELVVDLMKTARNLDIAIVISGDGDFAPAIRAVQEMGVRVEVISFRGNTSSDLIEVADLFTDITQLARVDKTSSRSGRRVAGDDEDLSMTEVPDKQTEGTGQRGRGRGRGRGRPGEAEPVAARSRSGGRTSGSRTAGAEPIAAPVAAGNGAMTVLPGEKLSRVSPAASAPAVAPADDIDDEDLTPFDIDPESLPGAATEGEGEGELDSEGEAGRRRRRRRGGRGRGRGRGRDGELLPAGEAEAREATASDGESLDDDEEEEAEVAPAPRGPRTTPFGSVWDSQIGTPTSAPAKLGPVTDDEDFDEPEIPEYLIAEQRRGRQGAGQGQGGQGGRGGQGRGGPRGGRSAYSAAIDRERYGRGGGGGGGGINRYPDVSGRTGQPGRSGGGRQEGGYARQDASYSRQQGSDRQDRPAPRGSGDPWSEVPPELEELLRAQLAQSPKARRPESTPAASRIEAAEAAGEIETMTEAASDAAAPKPRTTTRRKAAGDPATGAAATASTETASDAVAAEPAAPKRRTTARKAAAAPVVEAASEPAAAAPKRRTATRKTAAASGAVAAASDTAGDADMASTEPAAPKRRATARKKAEPA